MRAHCLCGYLRARWRQDWSIANNNNNDDDDIANGPQSETQAEIARWSEKQRAAN